MSEKGGQQLLGKIVDGTLDLTGKGLTSLSCIGIQPKLQVLIVNDNQLTSFKTLQPQPNLKKILAANNPLDYIDGLDKQYQLESLDISDTPISTKSNYRCKILATIKSLQTLNGKEFTQKEKQTAAKITKHFPDQQLISDGEKQAKALQDENKVLQFQMYMAHHKDQFGDFSRNEAVLWDLTTNGPLPIINEYSSDEDLKRAIVLLRRRNQKIASTFLNVVKA